MAIPQSKRPKNDARSEFFMLTSWDCKAHPSINFDLKVAVATYCTANLHAPLFIKWP